MPLGITLPAALVPYFNCSKAARPKFLARPKTAAVRPRIPTTFPAGVRVATFPAKF